MRILLFTGKGGVGKTTLSATTAVRSAQLGHHTLAISTDIAHSLSDVLETPLGNRPVQVGVDAGINNLWACELDTATELEQYWGEVRRQLAAAIEQEGVSAPAAGELAILPGLDEVLALVRIKRYYDQSVAANGSGQGYDVMVIDSAPTGAAMRLLSAPDLQRWYTRHLAGFSKGLARAIWPAIKAKVKLPLGEAIVRDRINQLFDQVNELREILTDPARTSVRLVLNPDHMSLQETQRAFTYMNLFGFSVDALYVNRLIPDAVEDPFFRQWKASQAEHRQAVRDQFAPLNVYDVPMRSSEVLGIDDLREMADIMYGPVGDYAHDHTAVDPTAPLTDEPMLRFYDEDGTSMLALRVVGVPAGDVDLSKQGDELAVKLGQLSGGRWCCPSTLAGQQPSWAQVRDGELRIAFKAPQPSDTAA